MNNAEYKRKLIERSIDFSKQVIRLVNTFEKTSASRVIADQLLRSATSVGANIVEAQGSQTKKDFTNFLAYGLKSAKETKYWLVLVDELGEYAGLAELKFECDQLIKILVTSIRTLRNG